MQDPDRLCLPLLDSGAPQKRDRSDEAILWPPHAGRHQVQGNDQSLFVLTDLLQNKDGVTFVPSFKYTLDLFYILPFYHIEVQIL